MKSKARDGPERSDKSNSRASKKRRQDASEDVTTGSGRRAAGSVSKKTRDTGRVNEDVEPREARPRQANLPNDEREQREPVDRGSADAKTRDKKQREVKEGSRWDQRRKKTFDDWANEKNEENEERRDKAMQIGSKAKKKTTGTGKAFTAKEWAEPELTAVAKTILFADCEDFSQELQEFSNLKIGSKRSRISLALAGISKVLNNIFATGEVIFPVAGRGIDRIRGIDEKERLQKLEQELTKLWEYCAKKALSCRDGKVVLMMKGFFKTDIAAQDSRMSLGVLRSAFFQDLAIRNYEHHLEKMTKKLNSMVNARGHTEAMRKL